MEAQFRDSSLRYLGTLQTRVLGLPHTHWGRGICGDSCVIGSATTISDVRTPASEPGIPNEGRRSSIRYSRCSHRFRKGSEVTARPILGGLHHEYTWQKIAA
jgi:hypothetical protein